MTYIVAGTVTIDGLPAPDDTPVQVVALTGAVAVIGTTAVNGGDGSYSMEVPDNIRMYRAIYDNGVDRGCSSLAPPSGTANPIAAFSAQSATLAVTFTDASRDPDGFVVGWAWTFGDGGTSTEQNPQHTYTSAGTYTVTLAVTDDLGATGSVSHDVAVASSNPPVFVAAGPLNVASSAQPAAPTWPAGQVQAGDIGILVLSALGSNTYNVNVGGFSEVTLNNASPQHDNAADLNARLQVAWCRAADSAPANPVVADIIDDAKVSQIFVVRGCVATGSPIDDAHGDTAGTSTTLSVPGGITTVPQCLIALISALRIDSSAPQVSGWTNAALAGLTERSDAQSAVSVGYGVAVATGVKESAGTFGATTAALATTSTRASIMLALRPA